MIILTGKVPHCFCLSLSSANIAIWGQPDYYYYYMMSYSLTWRKCTSCPQVLQPHFRVRDLHSLLYHIQARTAATCSPWRREDMMSTTTRSVSTGSRAK